MKSLSAAITENAVRPLRASRLTVPRGVSNGVLFIDYDGTLAPIASTPEQAKIPRRIQRALFKAAGHPRWIVSVVSGRRLDDVRRRVGLRSIVYAGNHGFEIQFPGQPRFIHPAARRAIPLINAIYKQVRRETARLKGVMVENKRYTLSLHTRLASVTDERRAHLALMHAARLSLRRKEMVIRRGKKVLELRPAAPWDKGRAVAAIMSAVQPPVVPVYFGDDNTDEDAFRALKNGITIRVGKGETNALFFIASVADMPQTLQRIVDLLPARRRGEPDRARFTAGRFGPTRRPGGERVSARANGNGAHGPRMTSTR